MPRIKEEVRKRIVHTWCTEKGVSFRNLAKRENISKDSVRKIINKFGEHGTVKDLRKSGRKQGPSNPKLDAKIVSEIRKNKSMSVRDLSRKLGTSVGMIQRVKIRHDLKTYRKQKVPKRSEKQKIVCQNRSRKLYDRLNNEKIECIIMDDETYVKMDSRTLPGPQYYTKRKGEVIDDSEKAIEVEKFGEKILVWQAICSCGLKSSSFYTKGTINAEIYRKECLQKRLIPFYKKHSGSKIFWPDLATAHYANTTLELLKSHCINFVEKAQNPPNSPELRPIERYWAIAKRFLRNNGKVAENLTEFKKSWSKATRKIKKTSVQNLMKGIKGQIRNVFRK